MRNNNAELGKMLRQQRLYAELTLCQLGASTGVSSSHLARIEKGERFPSAKILRKIAMPLGFEESELFTLAGYLSNKQFLDIEDPKDLQKKGLDTFVANTLAREPVQVQRAVIGILGILESLAKDAKDI
ncbi:MAG: helix-turn-helix transcriptional regulator [Dehalococcoidales bacterium]|nr:helix-turn-helix transcriptional regulator [Dehalococcoidales bacterium]